MTAEKEKTKKILTALDITAIVNDLKEKILGLRYLNFKFLF